MAKTTVYNLEKKSVGEIDLDDAIFGAEVNEGPALRRAQGSARFQARGHARRQEPVRRARFAPEDSTSRRARDVARHGGVQATQFRGGGIPHGPKVRSYAYRPPRKMRLGALRSALSLKLKEGNLTIVDDFELSEIKTKALVKILDTLEVYEGAVIVDVADNGNLRLSARNLAMHVVLPPEGVNLYDILRHQHLVLTKKAVEALVARLRQRKGGLRCKSKTSSSAR